MILLQIFSSSEDALSCDNIPAALMQSQLNPRPPTLPPKPRIGAGVAPNPTRGPPPPVTPRSSSLSANQPGQTGTLDVDQSCPASNYLSESEPESKVAGELPARSDKLSLDDKFASPQAERSGGSESSRGFEPEGELEAPHLKLLGVES